MTSFDKAFDRVFTNEGGFQNDPEDRGNWTTGRVGDGALEGTKFGISAMSYPHLNIEALTREEAKEIYRRDWWEPAGLAYLHPALAYQAFDAAINHGMYQSTKMLQRAAGAKADGVAGPKTRAAIRETEINDMLLRFLAERLLFMTNIRTWSFYGKGWARRVAHNLKYGSEDN